MLAASRSSAVVAVVVIHVAWALSVVVSDIDLCSGLGCSECFEAVFEFIFASFVSLDVGFADVVVSVVKSDVAFCVGAGDAAVSALDVCLGIESHCCGLGVWMLVLSSKASMVAAVSDASGLDCCPVIIVSCVFEGMSASCGGGDLSSVLNWVIGHFEAVLS